MRRRRNGDAVTRGSVYVSLRSQRRDERGDAVIGRNGDAVRGFRISRPRSMLRHLCREHCRFVIPEGRGSEVTADSRKPRIGGWETGETRRAPQHARDRLRRAFVVNFVVSFVVNFVDVFGRFSDQAYDQVCWELLPVRES